MCSRINSSPKRYIRGNVQVHLELILIILTFWLYCTGSSQTGGTEETGIEIEPTTLLAVECPSGEWYRFTFAGNITGGKLRTLEEKDSETLQDGYWPVDKVMAAAHKKGDPTK